MKTPTVILLLASTVLPLHAEPFEKAEVTRTINTVSLLAPQQPVKPAAVGDVVRGETAVRTGSDSRTELKFPDDTITRIGANALFRFQPGGRDMTLSGGALLFSSPKGAGGGKVEAGVISAAVSGTDFLLDALSKLSRRVTSFNGRVLVFLTRNPQERRWVQTGESLSVPANATSLGNPVPVDTAQMLANNPLFRAGGFGPLPSQALLEKLAAEQQARLSGDPVEKAIAEIGALGENETEKAEEIVRKALSSGKISDILDFVCGASRANPPLAPAIAAAVAKLYPKLAMRIARRGATCVPSQARAIALAVAGVAPDERESIFLAIWQALGAGGARVDLAALGFATSAGGVNPANLVHGDVIETETDESTEVISKEQ